MTERGNILARVREALTAQSPMPGHEHGGAHPPSGLSLARTARQWLPLVGETFDDRLALFQRNSAELKAVSRGTS